MSHPSSAAGVLSAERHIERALMHPAFSEWLKVTLRSAVQRDPIALTNDLELLTHLLRAWCDAQLDRDGESIPAGRMIERQPCPPADADHPAGIDARAATRDTHTMPSKPGA